MYYNLEHEEMVKNRGDGYTYLGTYKSKEITIDGKNKKMNKTYIRIKCPYCGKKYDVDIYTFKKGSSCTNCCHEYEKSFAYYIEEELGLDLNDVWDWEENSRRGINPWDITKQSHETVYIWCQDKWYHGSYKTTPHGFYQGNRCTYCVNKKVHPKDSFAQWGIDTFGDDFLDKYWSDKNTINPWKIAPQNNKHKIWIYCQEKDYHNDEGGYPTACYNFYKGIRCGYCASKNIHPKDSFGQWLIDTYGEDAIEKYWSPKNMLDPFTISKSNDKKIWILCQEKEYHNSDGGYPTTSNDFYNGGRCSFCGNHKVHPKDSFGALYPEKAKYWSENNDKTVFEVAPRSHDKYKFKCEKCGEEFERSLSDLNFKNTGVVCRDCNNSELEQLTKDILQQYDIEFERNKTFDGLFGLENGLLSYDFYIKNKKILIENQGKQHKYFSPGFHKSFADFEKQLEHDNRKRKYAEKYGFKLIEIWYDEIEKIENILVKELNL